MQVNFPIPDDIANKYNNPDQAERFEAAVLKVFSISPERVAKIRKTADFNPTPRGWQPKGETAASRVPVPLS